jgi:hypothetical protein
VQICENESDAGGTRGIRKATGGGQTVEEFQDGKKQVRTSVVRLASMQQKNVVAETNADTM